MKTIDTLLFDLDNTLLDFNKAERIALTRTLLDMGLKPEEKVLERYSVLNLAQWKMLERGEITRDQVKVRRYRLLFSELGVDCSAEEAAKRYEKYLGIGHYYMDGAEELLEHLFPEYRLYMVTNGTASVQHGRMKSAGMERYFQDVFISEEIGFNKPSREFFERSFARIPDFHKERALVIGDSLTSDILGGIHAGVKTVWFNPQKEANDSDIIPDYEISALKELETLLEQI